MSPAPPCCIAFYLATSRSIEHHESFIERPFDPASILPDLLLTMLCFPVPYMLSVILPEASYLSRHVPQQWTCSLPQRLLHQSPPRQNHATSCDEATASLTYIPLIALFWRDGLHLRHRLHLLRCCLRNRQVRRRYLSHGCLETGFDRQEYVVFLSLHYPSKSYHRLLDHTC